MIKRVGASFLQADSLAAAVVSKLDVALDVVVHQSIDSTNSWCLQQSGSGRALPFACFAEEQTSGRGRRGKRWLMSSNNIAMSLAWPFVLPEQPLHLLPLSIALAIVATLENFGVKQVQIKWPNDVYVQGKKIAGILIETQPVKSVRLDNNVAGKQVAVIIGLGLNYEMLGSARVDGNELLLLTDLCEQIALQKTALVPERHVVASELLCNVVAVCRDFMRVSEESLKKFRRSYDFCKQKQVDIILDKETLSGIAQGVNDDAELLVLIDGELRAFNSAEVSVRPGEAATMS